MKRLKYLSLAALVAFAACDEGEETITPPTPTGTITGVVQIEGSAASGVTVTLSSGATATTDGSGTYSFAGVAAGAYTVSISGYAADATFAAAAKAATIASDGQVVTVNFSGSYVRTSAIFGTVSVEGAGLAGVTVSIGTGTPQTTDANGAFSFSGLRANTYTVSISGYNSSLYTFATASASVVVGVGEAKIQNFGGAYVTSSAVSGRLFLDEATPKNNTFDAGIEANLSVAGVTVTLEGGAVNNTLTTETLADGTYSFPGLAPGAYRVTVASTDTDLPGNVAFGGTSASEVVTVTAGTTATVNWPFDITQQTIKVAGFLGTDADVSATPGPGITPISGWAIDLYDTQANATAGLAAGKLNSSAVTTDANGIATFRFLRANDVSPNAGTTDQIVFARAAGANADGSPTASHTLSGERIIEIRYNSLDSLGMAPDTLDAIYGAAVVAIRATEIDGDSLAGWQAVLRANKDSTKATVMSGATAASGWAFFNLTPASLVSGVNGSDGVLPDTLWMRLSTTQAGANGHGFTQTPSATEGVVAGGQLKFIWDGTVAAGDTIWLGAEEVKYTDVDVLFGVHHEKDDSTDVPTFTAGDATASVGAATIQLYTVNTTTGALTAVGGPLVPGSAGAPWKAWERPIFNLGVANTTYAIYGATTDASLDILNDTAVVFTLDGADQVDTIAPLSGSGGVSTFAMKANNAQVSGTVQSVDGVTGVSGLRVMIQATSDNIQPNSRGTDSTVVKTNAGGAYSMTGLREGPYMVSVEDSTGVWHFLNTLTTASAPLASGTQKAGQAVNNTDAHTAVRDVQGYASNSVANFQAFKMNTTISGVIINDRDADGNVIDPDEALEGAVLELYQDNTGAVSRDTLVATDTTDINGAYSFGPLREGQYMVRWTAGTPATPALDVLRALSTDSVIVTTTAAANVGTTSPATLPQWDYANSAGVGVLANPAHFMFLYKNTTAKGTVKAAGVGIASMTVSLRRCNVSAGATSPPTTPGPQTCTSYLGTTVNVVSDANGAFEFPNLTEGVYEIRPQPTTVAGWNTSVPSTTLYLLVGNGDIESLDFVIS